MGAELVDDEIVPEGRSVRHHQAEGLPGTDAKDRGAHHRSPVQPSGRARHGHNVARGLGACGPRCRAICARTLPQEDEASHRHDEESDHKEPAFPAMLLAEQARGRRPANNWMKGRGIDVSTLHGGPGPLPAVLVRDMPTGRVDDDSGPSPIRPVSSVRRASSRSLGRGVRRMVTTRTVTATSHVSASRGALQVPRVALAAIGPSRRNTSARPSPNVDGWSVIDVHPGCPRREHGRRGAAGSSGRTRSVVLAWTPRGARRCPRTRRGLRCSPPD